MLNSCRFDSIKSYLDFYGLKAAGHEFMSFKSSGFKLAGHVFVPKGYKATVFILHGYLGHCGLLSKIIKCLTEADFAVAAFDLPGQGLSSGEPTAIDDFSQYTDSLDDFLKIVKSHLHGPYHIIGHSTGAAVIMDYLFAGRKDYFDKIILTAPLVHSSLWSVSKIAYRMYRPFAKTTFRLFRNVSSDKDFLRFVRYKDPLQAKKVSVKWIDALFKWNDRAKNAESIARPVKLIQGASDNIVAWKYNLKFIQSKFSDTEIKLVAKGRHELFNESAEIREKVFLQIKDFLHKSEV